LPVCKDLNLRSKNRKKLRKIKKVRKIVLKIWGQPVLGGAKEFSLLSQKLLSLRRVNWL
jgi:hypothetical protein